MPCVVTPASNMCGWLRGHVPSARGVVLSNVCGKQTKPTTTKLRRSRLDDMPLNVRRRFGDVSRCGDENAIESPNAIRFFHPGYGKTLISTNAQPPIRDALISLPAFDDGGIHYDTAHTTCGVLAGNRWDGYFSLDRDSRTRVQPPADGILRERAYFFCLPPSSDPSTSTDPYPIVARFRDWRFPHRNLPPCWERLRPRFREGAHGSVRRCIFTDCGLSLDAAHLVPVKESSWYDDNGMVE